MCASLVLTTILLTSVQEVASLRPPRLLVPSPRSPPHSHSAAAPRPLPRTPTPFFAHTPSVLAPAILRAPGSTAQAGQLPELHSRHRLSGVSCSLTTLPPPHPLLTRCLGLRGAAASLSPPRPCPESGTPPGAPRGTRDGPRVRKQQPPLQLLCKRCWGFRQDQGPLTLARPGSRVSIDYEPGGHG